MQFAETRLRVSRIVVLKDNEWYIGQFLRGNQNEINFPKQFKAGLAGHFDQVGVKAKKEKKKPVQTGSTWTFAPLSKYGGIEGEERIGPMTGI